MDGDIDIDAIECANDSDMTATEDFNSALANIFKLMSKYRKDDPKLDVAGSSENEQSNADKIEITSEEVKNGAGLQPTKTGEMDEVAGHVTSTACADIKECVATSSSTGSINEDASTSKSCTVDGGSTAKDEESSSSDSDESSEDSDSSLSTDDSSSDEDELEWDSTKGIEAFSKLDLKGTLTKSTQRVNLRRLFKPGQYEALCKFLRKRVIRIENMLTLMVKLGLPLPSEDLIREKIGLPRLTMPSDSSDTDSDDGWGASGNKKKRPIFRGVTDEGTAKRMEFIKKYCEDRQSGRRQVMQPPPRRNARPEKVRIISEKKKPSFEPFARTDVPITGSGDASQSPKPKCRTRAKEDVKYTEEYVPEDDHFVFCEDCQKVYVDDCPDHPLTLMKDNEAIIGNERYSRQTCPPGLSVDPSSVKNAGYGVWCDIAIPKNTVFGPYTGELIKRYEVNKLVKVCDGGYSWEIYKNGKLSHYVDGTDRKKSNWMRFVNCARHEEEQNLIAFQYKGHIYYRAFKDIKPNVEFLVWYGAHYASQLGISMKLSKKNENIMLNKTIQESKIMSDCKSSNTAVASAKKTDSAQTSLLTDRLNSSNGKFQCPLCQKNLSSKRYLQLHIKTVHEKVKDFKCAICGKEFSHICSLKTHIRTHSGEKPYKCDICGVRSARSSDLQSHRRTHTGEKPYKCDVCGERFVQSGHLRSHRRTHTGEKPYRCDICGGRFAHSNRLQSHRRTHTGEKPYKCDVCGKRFVQSGHLRSHRRIHTGIF